MIIRFDSNKPVSKAEAPDIYSFWKVLRMRETELEWNLARRLVGGFYNISEELEIADIIRKVLPTEPLFIRDSDVRKTLLS